MKASEIQIGDWVIPHVFDSKLEPSKIVGIHYNSYKGNDYVDWVDCEAWDELSLNCIEPIPLTPAILEKNGFEEGKGCNSCRVFNIDEHNYILYNFNDSFIYIRIGFDDIDLQIQYVHQLQHALRLCGIEKEIEL